MCGFAGVLQREGRLTGDVPALAVSLGRALAHRGPDGSGEWQGPDGNVLLVHRRLAIIDPGPGGMQPMATPDRRFHIVFNGEIYNYRALRADLQSRGERFVTGSDTEVLLRLVSRGGPSRLSDARGMFAFACWDSAERSLLVARDRFGIKPLYVAADARRIVFASELGALRAVEADRRRNVGRRTSSRFCSGAVSRRRSPGSAAWTCWNRVHGGAGGSTDARSAVCSRTSAPCTRAIVNPRHATTSGDVDAFRAEVAPAVRESVRAHLVADVPVGVFLSGGIDSGALVSCATSIGASNLQTFTVGFDDESSEVERARSVADAFRYDASRTAPGSVDDRARTAGRGLARLDQPTDRRRELVLRLARRRRDRHQSRVVRRWGRRAVRRLPVVHAAASRARGQESRGPALAGNGIAGRRIHARAPPGPLASLRLHQWRSGRGVSRAARILSAGRSRRARRSGTGATVPSGGTRSNRFRWRNARCSLPRGPNGRRPPWLASKAVSTWARSCCATST